MLVAALIAGCSVSGQVMDGTLDHIKTSGTLNLGYRESAPPFSFPGPDKRPVGYSVDLCTHVAGAIQKQLGINLKLNWVPVTAENRLDMVAQGKVRTIAAPDGTPQLQKVNFIKYELAA